MIEHTTGMVDKELSNVLKKYEHLIRDTYTDLAITGSSMIDIRELIKSAGCEKFLRKEPKMKKKMTHKELLSGLETSNRYLEISRTECIRLANEVHKLQGEALIFNQKLGEYSAKSERYHKRILTLIEITNSQAQSVSKLVSMQ